MSTETKSNFPVAKTWVKAAMFLTLIVAITVSMILGRAVGFHQGYTEGWKDGFNNGPHFPQALRTAK